MKIEVNAKKVLTKLKQYDTIKVYPLGKVFFKENRRGRHCKNRGGWVNINKGGRKE